VHIHQRGGHHSVHPAPGDKGVHPPALLQRPERAARGQRADEGRPVRPHVGAEHRAPGDGRLVRHSVEQGARFVQLPGPGVGREERGPGAGFIEDAARGGEVGGEGEQRV
jgi:hypothetical protein